MGAPSHFALPVALCATAMAGCASTPKQAVELSATVGRDIAAVQLAHVALASRYFDRMEADVNAFVNGAYRSYSIDKNMRDFKLVEKVADPSKAGPDLDALDVMETFVEVLTADIDDMRRKLLDPVRQQRTKVLVALEEAYRRIQDGQGVVTAHLASIAKVHELQDEMLAKGGLDGLRERIVDSTAKASDQIQELARKAQFANDKADEFAKTLEEVKKATASF